MTVYAYAVCAVAAAMVTSVELAFRNQRHPFGDRRFKASAWWLVVVLIDAVVACLMLLGAVAADVIDASLTSSTNGVVKGIAIGALGPLALRSPVRRTEVENKESPVGITYIYDIARLHAVYALDERFVRLKRKDVTATKERWQALGLNADLVAVAISRHLQDHQHLPLDRREAIVAAVENAQTLPTDDQIMTAIIKIVKRERFTALIDELDAYTEGSLELAVSSTYEDAEVIEEVDGVTEMDGTSSGSR